MDSAHDNSTDDKNGKMVVVITAMRLFVFSMLLCTSLWTVIGNMPSAPQGMLIGKGDLSTSQAEVREPKVLRKVWIMWQELRWEWQWRNNIKCFKTKVFLKKALHHRKEWVDDVRNYQVACLLDVHLFFGPTASNSVYCWCENTIWCLYFIYDCSLSPPCKNHTVVSYLHKNTIRSFPKEWDKASDTIIPALRRSFFQSPTWFWQDGSSYRDALGFQSWKEL